MTFSVESSDLFDLPPSPTTFPSEEYIEEVVSADPEKWVIGRHVLEQLEYKLRKQGLPGREHVEAYLREQYRHHCRPNTIRNSYHGLMDFLRFMKETGKGAIEEIVRRDVEAFVEYELDCGLKLSTVRTRLALLKAFLRYLIEKGVVADDVFPWKLKIKLPETLPRAMDPEDVSRLLGLQSTSRDRAMLLLLLRTGMRIGELLNTRVADVNLKEQKILIYESEKNAVGRVVYFSEDAGDALNAWLKKRDPEESYLFYGQKEKPLSYTAARMMFVKYLGKAGLAHKSYTLHSLRHTYATELLNAGMPLECLEKLLGHSSLEVTRRYARLSDRTREEEYFKAMAIIERGEEDACNGWDRELQEVLETTQLLAPHGEDLHEHP